MNGDGDLDLLATLGPSWNLVGWYQNDGSANFTERLISSDFTNAVGVQAGYINNDNYIDVVGIAFSTGTNNVRWWENDGTPEDLEEWEDFGIASGRLLPNGQDLVDLDLDGDIDVVVAEFGDVATHNGRISWWSNDGSGNFTFEENITINLVEARSIKGADMDGDGDIDLVSAASLDTTNANTDGDISWYENDGSQNFVKRTITTTFDYAYWAVPIDFEGDGDMDIVASAQNAYQIAWWESDLDDAQFIAAGNQPATGFWGNKVIIDFSEGDDGDSVTVFYNAGKNLNPNSLGVGIDHIATRGYYTITTKKTGYTASIDFYYGSGNVPEWSAITPGSEEELVLCVWDDTNSEWVIAGTSQNVDVNDDSITVSGISTEMKPFSKWTLGSSTMDNPLPVLLASFSSQIVANGIQLNWVTASEINNLGFEVWRSESVDSNYTLIADFQWDESLRGAGNSNHETQYFYLDKDVQPGYTYYYVLVDVDFNSDKMRHGPIEVIYDTQNLVSTFQLGQNYPNPFNAYTRIPIFLSSSSVFKGNQMSLKIYNILGNEIKNLNIKDLNTGLNEITWDGTDNSGRGVASGQYMYRFEFDGKSQTQRLILIK
jgi:hypothetical protein